MPRIGNVHNDAFSVDNKRLYNIGGERGINLVKVFPNGVGLGQIVIVGIAMLVWTLPLTTLLGLGFQDMGGLGTLVLLTPPVLVAIIGSRKLSNDISPAQWISFKTAYYIRQSRHTAGNAAFIPVARKSITASVFMPRTNDQETR